MLFKALSIDPDLECARANLSKECTFKGLCRQPVETAPRHFASLGSHAQYTFATAALATAHMAHRASTATAPLVSAFAFAHFASALSALL